MVKGLDSLPDCVLVNIFQFLYPRDVAMVSATCKRLHAAANCPLVWERFANLNNVPPVPMHQMKADSPFWEAQQACVNAKSGYKYAVCESFGRPIQDVGMTFDNVNYGRVRVGSVVIIHKHRPVAGNTNWSSSMDKYDGKVGFVAALRGQDAQGCAVVNIDFMNVIVYIKLK